MTSLTSDYAISPLFINIILYMSGHKKYLGSRVPLQTNEEQTFSDKNALLIMSDSLTKLIMAILCFFA